MSSLKFSSGVPPIHLYPHYVREVAKQTVANFAPRRDIFNIPGILGIGIGHNHIKVTVTGRHPHQNILPSEVNGIPVVIEERDQPRHRARTKAGGGGGAAGGTLTGGSECPSGCATTGIVVDPAGVKYILSCAHCFGKTNPSVTFGGKVVGTYTRSALRCADTANHLDASIAQLSPGVVSDFNIKGLGAPTGLAQPAVGDTATIQGPFAGKVSGKITTVSYSFKDTYPEISGNCNVTHVNQFEANLGKIGDSGAATWNQNNKLIGIDFDGDGIEIFNNINYLQAELGVQFGALAGGAVSSSTPNISAPITNSPLSSGLGISQNEILVGGGLLALLLVSTML